MIRILILLMSCLSGCAPTDRAFSDLADAAGIPTHLPAPDRLIAIGDVHGDLKAAKKALRLAGVIDSNDKWSGGQTVVVQLGDQLDRGDDERAIIDTFRRLEAEAKAVGGGLYWLIGNHEVMNALIDFRYITTKGFKDFEDFKPLASGDTYLTGLPSKQKGRGAAFRPGGPYAQHLAGNNVVMKIGDSVFVHGGIQKKYAQYGLEKINSEMRAWLKGAVNNAPAWVDDDSGPLWDRTYGENFNTSACKRLKETLQLLGATRMVVGHTVQVNGITSRCAGRAWRIDTGMSAYYGGPVEVLEIRPGGIVKVLR